MRVGLFVTCVNDALFPETGKATVRLLERLGCEVDFPLDQTCCGQMHFNTGYRPECTPIVRGFVDAFRGYDAVVVPSGSCAGMIRHYHPVVADESGSAALRSGVADTVPRVHELTEFLVDVLDRVDVGARFPHRVTYHPTCHSLRLLGVGDRPLRLLRAVEGIEVVDLPAAEECCGFGGTFAVKNPDVSTAMGVDKIGHIEETGAEVVVAGDNSCLTHLGGLIGRRQVGVRTMHLAEVLASTGDAA
ncbi:MAG: (Fe-S)-binding protein [Streptosporangiales bacterium]|nr:(Fe-S)-binding protein [Streptosporangiales bacterium]